MKRFLRTSPRNLVGSCLGSIAFIVCACTLSLAGGPDSHRSDARGHEFNSVVHAIESHYGVHHMRIPFLSFAVSLAARPSGVDGMKLAVFENFHSSSHTTASTDSDVTATDDLRSLIEHSLGPDWSLFVRTRTHDNSDSDDALIYVNMGNGKLQMMIVTLDSDDATVVEMNLSDRALKKWIDEPKDSADEQSGHHKPSI